MAKLFYYVFAMIFIFRSTTINGLDCHQFNFGDSNTDTGGRCSSTGYFPLRPDQPFNCRASNGLLYIDYLAENLGTSHLAPFMEAFDGNFTGGANFAVYAMPAQPKPEVSFPLPTQVKQFEYFRYRVLHMPRGKGPNITEDGIRNAIYSIDIGQNDVSKVLRNSTHREIEGNISAAIVSVENAIRKLYDLGSRKFLLYNTGPIGCLPAQLINKQSGDPLDRVGCVAIYNEVAQKFNNGLRLLSTTLQTQLKEAVIVYVNMFDIKYNLIANSTSFGFENPLVPCINWHTFCLDQSKVINWDGTHYTDAANKVVASMVWSGLYTSPYQRLSELCRLRIGAPHE